MKRILVLMLLLASTVASAQKNINDYKYVIVPKKFGFLKEADQYRLNTFTKMFLEKYGFTVYFDDEVLPMELANANCNKLYVDVIESNTMFKTNLEVLLKDCTKSTIWKSAEGSSREKEYKVAYQQALREAFNSFDAVGYKYEPVAAAAKQQTNTDRPLTITPVTTEKATEILTGNAASNSNLLFAQPIENGFQIVDTTPRIILKLKKTSLPNVFLAENDQARGILFARDGKWIFEFYGGNQIFSETMDIKF